MQSVPDAMPSVVEYLPATQLWQTVAEDAPTEVENFPTPHGVQSAPEFMAGVTE